MQCWLYWYKLKMKLELTYIVLYRISVLVVSIDRLYFAIHTIPDAGPALLDFRGFSLRLNRLFPLLKT